MPNMKYLKYMKMPLDNENRNVTFQNLWDTAKAVLRDKFTVMQADLRKQGKYQISKLTFHHKEFEKELTDPVSSRKEIIKIKQEIDTKIENVSKTGARSLKRQ